MLEQASGPLARLADGDVVVADDRLELAVGRLLRLAAVDVERRPHRPGEAAAAAAAAASSAGALLCAAAVSSSVQRHGSPGGPCCGGPGLGLQVELNRLSAVDEREGVERQLRAP